MKRNHVQFFKHLWMTINLLAFLLVVLLTGVWMASVIYRTGLWY